MTATTRLALALWLALCVGVTGRLLVCKANANSVVGIYLRAGQAWLDGTDPYAVVPDSDIFRYHPLVAAGFTPLTLLPVRPAEIGWRALGVGLMLWGLFRFRSDFLPGLTPSRAGTYYALAALLALPSVNNGQANPHLLGLMLLAGSASMRGRLNLAAILLAVATVFKVYPAALALLFALKLPRRFLLYYAGWCLGLTAAAFLLQEAGYVARAFATWAEYMRIDDRHAVPLWRMSRDFRLILTHLRLDVPGAAYSALCLGMAGLAAWQVRRSHNKLGAALVVGPLWMTAFGPATESNTYTLLGACLPAICLSSGGRLRWLAYGGAALVLMPFVAMAFPGGARLDRFAGQPLGALLLWAAWAGGGRTIMPGDRHRREGRAMDEQPALDLQEGVATAPEATEPAVADGWAEVFAAIKKAGELEHDWDGQGASAIPPTVIQTALGLGVKLRAKGWIAPDDYGESFNGSVYMKWHLGPANSSIEVCSADEIDAEHWNDGDAEAVPFEPLTAATPFRAAR